ncbi:MAG: HAD-IB family hydrolase, partial [Chitinophagaceae bacterium]|nr:HAD-IB family hydrolase [Chitinophagaceae bacterium]
KAIRIKEVFDIGLYEKIFAYGDSRGDKEMLALATDAFYRKF